MMTIEWEEYKKYEDGSYNSGADGIITIGDNQYEVSITDHTTEQQMESDWVHKRHVSHAYTVSGLPHYLGSKCFKEVGFDFGCAGVSTCGIEDNPEFKDDDEDKMYYQWRGGKPTHSIKDIEMLVEEAVVRSFNFDYQKAVRDAIDRINSQILDMNEVNAYATAKNIETPNPFYLPPVPYPDIFEE